MNVNTIHIYTILNRTEGKTCVVQNFQIFCYDACPVSYVVISMIYLLFVFVYNYSIKYVITVHVKCNEVIMKKKNKKFYCK